MPAPSEQAVACTVVDAGARYGLHPSWAELRRLASFHLFEIDPDEVARLSAKYADDPGISVHPVALFSTDGESRWRQATHRGLNSLYDVDWTAADHLDLNRAGHVDSGESSVVTRALDSMFPDTAVHFLKLDIEGAEFDALKGAERQLRDNVLGVRAEVGFAPFYKNAGVFCDIHQYLGDHGFELLNLDYDGRGNPAGPFAPAGRHGRLAFTDAVWVVHADKLFRSDNPDLRHDLVRMGVFLMLNNAADVAVQVLLRGIEADPALFESCGDDPLFRFLHRKLAWMFKGLLAIPVADGAAVRGAYRSLFGRDFPEMHEFYDSDILKL